MLLSHTKLVLKKLNILKPNTQTREILIHRYAKLNILILIFLLKLYLNFSHLTECEKPHQIVYRNTRYSDEQNHLR